MSPLPLKRKRFALEYLKDLNATQAAIRAGYSKKSAAQQGSVLLRDPKVAAFLKERQQQTEQKGLLVAEELEKRLQEIIDFDPRRLYRPVLEDGQPKVVDGQAQYEPVPLPELPDDVARALSGFEVEELFEGPSGEKFCVGRLKKWKRWDPSRALELAMKRRGLLIEKHLVATTTSLEDLVMGSLTPKPEGEE